MALSDDMTGIEGRLKDRGLTVADLCRAAEIARSTWDRWRRGETEPNLKTWREVVVAADRLAAVQDGEAA